MAGRGMPPVLDRDPAKPKALEEFDYELPPELVAQRPLERRDASRLLVVRRESGRIEDRVFADIAGYFRAGDVLVLNDTKVFPARLHGRKETGGRVEALLLGPARAGVWRALLRPAPKEGGRIFFEGGKTALFRGRDSDGAPLLEFDGDDVGEFARLHGRMPLPPYIRRDPDRLDADTYQTVYAARTGAVAAPTAGLHFTADLLEKISRAGAEILTVTLHVGAGTFRPVKDIATHRMHAEEFELSPEVAGRLNAARDEGRKIWAVGTTSVRVLETCMMRGRLVPGSGRTDLFITPPAEFEAVDRLVTNFHLPRSTLLMLVSAFLGTERTQGVYRHAVEKRYRFYSYGDAMLIH